MAKKIVRIAFCLAIVWIASAAVLAAHVRADTDQATAAAGSPNAQR